MSLSFFDTGMFELHLSSGERQRGRRPRTRLEVERWEAGGRLGPRQLFLKFAYVLAGTYSLELTVFSGQW